MDEIWRWSAARMAEAIRAREITAREAVEAALLRLEQVEPVSNAFGDRADDALTCAKEADAALARGDDVGPLHGVPIAFKDNHDIAGRATTHGVQAFAQMPPATETCPPASRMLEAGAIEVGRTRMPPFGLRWTTETEWFGPTRNPWDPNVTAGASSGGAGVAVATGVVPLAVGNDIGGSIRYPAAVNGVLGLRPTLRRVPNWCSPTGDGMPLATREFFVEGPIARTVDDLRIALRILQRPDPRDPEAAAPPAEIISSGTRPRIAVVRDPGDHAFAIPNLAEVDSALSEAAERLAALGYDVVELRIPELGEAATLWWQLTITEFDTTGYGAGLEQFGDTGMRTKWNNMVSLVREAFGEVGIRDLLGGYYRRTFVRRRLSELMVDHPVLLLPSSGEPPFRLGDDVSSRERTRELMCHQWPNLAVPLLGLPAVGMGTHVRPGAAPLGVQLVGRGFADETVLSVAEDLQRVSGVVTPIDPRPPASAT
ncbi:amidase [Mycobacterium sp.]|uniref:amidase n=1 Tax=Mycobacterium sp. TaxID=1785 RepID=UPI002C96BA2D|nr:amidase [Mycobacterium sp.]HKP40507.1 amidase [Mycobacterium sp.]